jgi:hypothetical protein
MAVFSFSLLFFSVRRARAAANPYYTTGEGKNPEVGGDFPAKALSFY